MLNAAAFSLCSCFYSKHECHAADIDGKFNFDDLVRGDQGAFHSQGYKDALFPVTIEGQLLDLGMIMLEEDEINKGV
jgi:hypothetical protein